MSSEASNISYDNMSFRALGWLQYHGPLTAENILQYFYLSPFYETDSVNEELRVQGAIRTDYLETKVVEFLVGQLKSGHFKTKFE